MILFKHASALSNYLSKQKENGKSIGFVPTMGALHQGHLSLLARAKQESDLVVCSIFVNPTQFNNADDFANYPVTQEHDIELLTAQGCDVLFLPARNEIYPDAYKPQQYDLGNLESVLEGFYRPGHFQGVCQVVDRLLQIVDPNHLYLGQKDYQQCQVIQRLLVLLGKTNITLVIAPTVREKDGLAMSSRNLRLTQEQRKIAPALFQELNMTKVNYSKESIEAVKSAAIRHLTEQGFRVDYFEIADAISLATICEKGKPAVALVAAYLNEIRLIDNLPLN